MQVQKGFLAVEQAVEITVNLRAGYKLFVYKNHKTKTQNIW